MARLNVVISGSGTQAVSLTISFEYYFLKNISLVYRITKNFKVTIVKYRIAKIFKAPMARLTFPCLCLGVQFCYNREVDITVNTII